MSLYKKTMSAILFLIIYSTQTYAQSDENHSVINLDVDVNVYSGEIEVNPLDLKDLKVSIYGSINIRIYGIYNPTIPRTTSSKKISLSISPNPINTTLTPIIIPPIDPDSHIFQSTKTNINRILLGVFSLSLINPIYDFQTVDYIFGLRTTQEVTNIVIDQEEIPIKVFNPLDLADLIAPYAETLKNGIGGIENGVIIKAYIMNIGKEDITKKSTVKLYSKKNNKFQLLGSSTLESLDKEEQKSISLSIKNSIYQSIMNDYIYIMADADDDIFEKSNNNNTLEYKVPEIELSNDNIKAYPNPFDKTVNFDFYMNNDSSSYVLLTIYDYNLNILGKQRYLINPSDTLKTISYSDNSLASGKYIYSLLIENIQYYSTIVKK